MIQKKKIKNRILRMSNMQSEMSHTLFCNYYCVVLPQPQEKF